ncbi:MAG: ankyrin repeat domain-containing protein [Rubrivivax sp.]|nr:ankyrin repeat domain-containing protein [Rubrivivax sp.]
MALSVKSVFPNDPIAQDMATAATRGDVATLQQLKARGADVKVRGQRSLTLPHLALHAPNPAALVWLVQQGADPVSALENGATVPHYALSKKDSEGKPTAAWLEPLLKLGVSPNLIGDEGQYTLLVGAAIFENLPAARALKQAGANMNLMPDPLKGTAIHLALTRRNLDMAADLADLGVDPRIGKRMGDATMNAAQQYCKFLGGRLIGPNRQMAFSRMEKSFERWGLQMPCGF